MAVSEETINSPAFCTLYLTIWALRNTHRVFNFICMLWNKWNAVLSFDLNCIVYNEHVLKGTKDMTGARCDSLTDSLMTTLDKVAYLHVFAHQWLQTSNVSLWSDSADLQAHTQWYWLWRHWARDKLWFSGYYSVACPDFYKGSANKDSGKNTLNLHYVFLVKRKFVYLYYLFYYINI